MTERFSARHGYGPPAAKITVHEDAPPDLRGAIPLIAEDVGMLPSNMRSVICRVLLKQPDRDNWSEYPNIWGEVYWLMEEAPWYKVYDIAEAIYAELCRSVYSDFNANFPGTEGASESANKFGQRLNDFFVQQGIGWRLSDGQIIRRGSEAFVRSTREIPDRLDEFGHKNAATELREASRAISRRPSPNVTGAMHHAMAALEATAREITGKPNPTLGALVRLLELPQPLDHAVRKLWGYTSDRARHVRENQNVHPSEAELIVAVSGSLCDFLIKRRS